MSAQNRLVVEGFKLPSTDPITESELAWIEMLRCIAVDTDQPSVLQCQPARMIDATTPSDTA